MNFSKMQYLKHEKYLFSRFDKLSSKEFQNFLCIASISGQYFSNEIALKILRLFAQDSALYSISDTVTMIKNNDTYHFLKVDSDSSSDYYFSHYIVQQSIKKLQTPKQQKAIHKLYIDYYECAFLESSSNSVNSFSCLTQLISHLLQVDDEFIRKQKYFYEIFVRSCEMSRFDESKEYYNYLSEIRKVVSESNVFNFTDIERAKECRYLAELHKYFRNLKEGLSSSKKSLEILGFVQPKSPFSAINMFTTIINHVLKISKLSPAENQKRSHNLCKKLFHLDQKSHGKIYPNNMTYDLYVEAHLQEAYLCFQVFVDTIAFFDPDLISLISIPMPYFIAHAIYDKNELECKRSFVSVSWFLCILKMTEKSEQYFQQSIKDKIDIDQSIIERLESKTIIETLKNYLVYLDITANFETAYHSSKELMLGYKLCGMETQAMYSDAFHYVIDFGLW